MSTQDYINIYALTDCHQEARKLCSLFGGIVATCPPRGQNTLICDGGDLFKGIYDRELCVQSYLKLRQLLPQAKIVIALGNNDFGFNAENLNFLKQTTRRFNQANIHVLCANLVDETTQKCPNWVDPYILLNINGKKIMVTAFCINYIRLQKYHLHLDDITESFWRLKDTVKHIEPDALIVLNHALLPSSLEIYEAAQKAGITVDLLVGGHEHNALLPDAQKHIYYPQAYSRTMYYFTLATAGKPAQLTMRRLFSCKDYAPLPMFEEFLAPYETRSGLNTPVAFSTLDLVKEYSDPSSLGTFITDQMRAAAKADIGLLSTGFICHSLRFEAGKMLTNYNIERAFSAETPLQTVKINTAALKSVLNNALRYRYIYRQGNTRFLHCSQNLAVVCRPRADATGEVVQIYINNRPLLDENRQPLYPNDMFVAAIDPFIGAGELGFDALRNLEKETLMQNDRLVKIKDLFIAGIQAAAAQYMPGSEYPFFKLIDEK